MLRKSVLVGGLMLAAFLGGMCAEWMQLRTARAADAPAAKPTAQTLTVGKLVLVDAEGKQRAVLAVEDGQTQLSLYDEKGAKRVIVGQFPVQDGIPFWGLEGLDLAGKRRFASGVHADGSGAGEGIYSPAEAIRYGLGFTSDGNGGMTINDSNGKQRWGMGMPANGGVSMSFKDADGKVVEGLQKPTPPPTGEPVGVPAGK